MEEKTLTEGLKNLREGKKRKFEQTLDLVVNLKQFDVRKEALNTFITLPHGQEKKVAAFFTKPSKLVDTLTEEDFKKYKEPKQMKKLAKQYDMFIAVAPMMGKIASHFGRVFGPLGKMPSPQAGIIPQEKDEMIQEVLKKVGNMVRVRNKELAIKLPIGKENMSDKELEENIRGAIQALEQKLPRGKENVKEILIKFTMTKPEKIRL